MPAATAATATDPAGGHTAGSTHRPLPGSGGPVALPPTAFLHPFARPSSDAFTTIARARGALLWDDAGRRYIDAMASLWYCQVGHARAELIEAVDHQLRTLDCFHTFERFTNEPAEAFAAAVAGRAPMADARVFLTSSGSEAVDTALKLARVAWSWDGHPERHVVVSRQRGYHGVAYGGTSAQGLPANREHWGPLLDNHVRVPADDLDALAEVLAARGHEVAAVLVEPLQGAAGVFPPAPGYLAGVRSLCDEHGALLVLDEVITGFGRLGTWFAAERYGVVPDLLTFAKGATSGYQPLGGVVVGPRVRAVLEADPERVLRHGFTYSGHPAACAAGVANIAVLDRDGLLARAGAIGDRLGPALEGLVDDGLAAEVRGEAGIWGVGTPEGVDAQAVRDAMVELGVIPRGIGERTIALCPPLVISDDELDEVVDALRASLAGARTAP